jgi:D-glycero-D-manno-heptose 1,7-bisphosphate phosphatase
MSRFTSKPINQIPQQQIQQDQYNPNDWPQVFSKPVIGLDRDGTIIEDIGKYITSQDQVIPIIGSLEAIRMMRLKGYRVIILTNQAGISKGSQTIPQVESVHQHLLKIFGQAGIFSIDGLYYSTSNLKEDEYAKPNIGMFRRASNEMGVDFSKGWYVGDKISDLKAATNVGAKPILVKTGYGKQTAEKINTFANRDLKKSTKVFNNLLEFAQSLD